MFSHAIPFILCDAVHYRFISDHMDKSSSVAVVNVQTEVSAYRPGCSVLQ